MGDNTDNLIIKQPLSRWGVKGTAEVLPASLQWDEEEIDKFLTPSVILPDQLHKQQRVSGELLLLKQILQEAIHDFLAGSKRQKDTAIRWLFEEDYGQITLSMCLNALGIENITNFRVALKKYLSNGNNLALTRRNARIKL